jgi:hypothetical protein
MKGTKRVRIVVVVPANIFAYLPAYPEYKPPPGEEKIPCFYQGGLVFGKFGYVFFLH